MQAQSFPMRWIGFTPHGERVAATSDDGSCDLGRTHGATGALSQRVGQPLSTGVLVKTE